MILVLLFGISSKTSVLASILKGDVPYQDGDVVLDVLPHKLYSIFPDFHNWIHSLICYHRLTHLSGSVSCQSSKNATYKPRKAFTRAECSYRVHGAVVVELPAEVEVFNANAAGVCAGQHDRAAVHRLQEGNLPHRHLQGLSRPHA